MSQSAVGERALGGLELAHENIQKLIDYGVREFVVCPGSRNQPFLNVLLNENKLKKWYGFEERSSAFFALGRIRQTRRPVAVVVTSGTAVGELMPAVMEAYYTSLPLVLLTADRPERCRHLNTPQTCDQDNIFGIYAQEIYEWDGRQPVHINVRFEEPARKFVSTPSLQFDKEIAPRALACSYDKLLTFYNNVKQPLVIVSSLKETRAVKAFLLALNATVYIEATSQLREDPDLATLRTNNPTLLKVDGVLRIGGVPTHRIWRDLDDLDLPVLSITDSPFSGVTNGEFIHAEIEPFFHNAPIHRYEPLFTSIEYPLNKEEAAIRAISEWAPLNSLIYLGNSLPIREWDKAATPRQKHFRIEASRGLNGIDGQISTFLGLSEAKRHNIGIFGDLTTLYDLQALWFLASLDHPNIQIVIINNGGGMIFDQMYRKE
ncbi:MAG: thiamine pyrophosphate-binding protein, partial [Parachlamydiaceae bacterium]